VGCRSLCSLEILGAGCWCCCWCRARDIGKMVDACWVLLSRQSGRQARPNCFAPPSSRLSPSSLHPATQRTRTRPRPRPISPSPLPSQLQRNNNSVSRTNRLDLSIVFPVRKRPFVGKSTRDSLAPAHDSRHYCSLCTRIAGSQLWIQPRRFARACEWTHNCTVPPFFLPSGTASMMIH
jgi:hypothetical protein